MSNENNLPKTEADCLKCVQGITVRPREVLGSGCYGCRTGTLPIIGDFDPSKAPRRMTEAEKFIELNKINPLIFNAKISPEFMAKAVELFPERKEAVEQVYGEFAVAIKGAIEAMYAVFASKLRNALGNNKIVFLPEHRPVPSMRNVSKIIVPGNGRKNV